jgi:GT2 family glycosyltransferase
MTSAPIVSAIIVNWNGAHHLRVCLPSLLGQTYKALEIIVVDNSSTDDSAAVAREYNVRWHPLTENLGLAPALNRGAQVAAGEFFLFINNDMRFDPGFVSALLEPFRIGDRLFATDGMQFDWDGQNAGHLAARLSRNARRNRASTELVPGLHFHQEPSGQPTTVFMASAACMLVRKSVFDQLGGFDDRLPLGYEDVEICWRGAILGWKTIYVPTAICWHRVGSSGRSLEGERFNFRGILKGRLLFSTKLLPFRYALLTWFISAAALAKDLLHFRWPFPADRVKVLLEFAVLIPRFLKEKRELFRIAKTTPRGHLDRVLRLGEASGEHSIGDAANENNDTSEERNRAAV